MEPIEPGQILKSADDYILTFDGLAADQHFIEMMRAALRRLEKVYRRPVDIEFALDIATFASLASDEESTPIQYRLHILECRPLSVVEQVEFNPIPHNLDTADLLFSTHCLLPSGQAQNIQYAVFVDPQQYLEMKAEKERLAVAGAIGRLNEKLPARSFIFIGPGRWGSANNRLSVPVRYSDICGSVALVELVPTGEGQVPELAYGTDFYQDLVEANIYDLPLHLDAKGGTFNWAFFRESPNHLAAFSPEDFGLSHVVRVIDVPATTGKHLHIAIDDKSDKAVGYLAHVTLTQD
jgi:hypothetical protein